LDEFKFKARHINMAPSKIVAVMLDKLSLDRLIASRAPHVERGELECLNAALPALSALMGPASRVIECGPFAGHWLHHILTALERPKAGVILTEREAPQAGGHGFDIHGLAEITHHAHNALLSNWPLKAIAAGKTLVTFSGGAFGLLDETEATAFLSHANEALSSGDFLALTLEQVRDAAIMEALYHDYCRHLTRAIVAQSGRGEGLEARSFFNERSSILEFGALASKPTYVMACGELTPIEAGAWIPMGAVRFFDPLSWDQLHQDFHVNSHFVSTDQSIALVLLQKV
jgi:hypothetical protein